MHIAFLKPGAGLLQFAIALFQLFDQSGPLEFARLHFDRHHAESFGQTFQIRGGCSFFCQFKQGVFIGGTPPGQVVAQPDQLFQHPGGIIFFNAHGVTLS